MEEITMELKSLAELIKLIDSNLKFNITIFLGLLTLFLGLAGWALYLFAKSIVEKSVQSKLSKMKDELKQELHYEIKPIKDEVYQLKGGLDERVIDLIDNRSKIRWASGTIGSGDSDHIAVHGLNGIIDWESPITNVRIRDIVNKTELPFELVKKGENRFTIKLDKAITGNYFEWIIVWYDKSE